MSERASGATMKRVVVEARTNIALVKYWGKRDPRLNLPAVGSLSLTLAGLATRTELRFDPALAADQLFLDGKLAAGKPLERVSNFLDLVRARAGFPHRAAVRSANNFPTAAGLASSASGFAALALAATRAAGLEDDPRALSQLARVGSGSAARSIFGGFVLLHRGERADGADCFAEHIADWDLRLVLGVAGEGPKSTLSTDGMAHTAETSPYFRAWVDAHPADLVDARDAVLRRDLPALGEVAERSCLRMHASALAARPGIVYWSGATVEGFHAVRALRASGTGAWFTNDAGPHVKALCAPADAEQVAAALAAVPGITRTIVCAPGGPATVIEEEPV
jgi:diphosphomevalonate decarboxylase